MIYFKTITTLFLFNFFLQNINAQWNLINPLPFEANINSCFFINENIGWLACDYGEIYKTTNGGNDWVKQESPTTGRLHSVYFLDELVGFITGWDGLILKTNNGGNSWEIKANNLAYFLSSIYFIDEMNGWVVGYDGKIFHSSDGGKSWATQLSNVYSSLTEVHFFDQNIGWAVGWNESNSGNKILKTTNGGITWNTVYSDYTSNYLYCLTFIDSLNGFAAGSSAEGGKIISTIDGGQSWNIIFQTTFSYDWFNSIFFSDSINGWAVGGFKNLIVRTTDGGQNWFEINSGINEPLWDSNNDVFFVSANLGWVFNSGRVMYKTTNGGETWFNQSRDFIRDDLVAVEFLNELNGFALNNNTKILKTTDSGYSWSSKSFQVGKFSQIYFINNFTGYIAGTKNIFIPPYLYIPQGVVLKTTNEGSDWIEIFNGQMNSEFRDIFFSSDSIGWISGVLPGLTYKTTDGGINWTLQGSEFDPETINSLYFINENSGFAAGNRIYKTIDGGNNWTQLPFIPNNQLLSIFFLNIELGFVLGSGSNELYKTTDGGDSWSNLSVEPGVSLGKIIFINDSTGYILGADRIYITTDQGQSWMKQVTPYHWGLNDLSFIDDNRGWIVGSRGFIMNTANGGVTFIEDEFKNTPPTVFLLNQNYPNPFNPSTKISWQTPVGGWQTLKIYDVLGREITTLVDEYKNTGSYEVEFNASNLPNSVYFYRLQAGDYIETKKMILIK